MQKLFIAICLIFLIVLVAAFSLYFKKEKKCASQNRKENELFKARVMRDRYNVNCKLLFEDDENERNKSIQLMQELRGNSSEIKLLDDSNFIFDFSKCSLFREVRGYDKHKVTDFEAKFPLAYTILVNENVEQFERVLRVIYRPQNIYCIHVDRKRSADLQMAIESISGCFDNVFIATKTERVFWGHFSLLRAQLNCMSDLLSLDNLINVEKHPRLENKRVIKWKYWLNLPGTFLPIRTNLEMTRILSMYNGTSDVEISKIHPNPERVYSVAKLYWNNVVYMTGENKSSAPYNFSILKNSNYIAASHLFVDYIINSEHARNLTVWSEDTFIPVCLIHLTKTILTNFK
jgi:hypothetical protein